MTSTTSLDAVLQSSLKSAPNHDPVQGERLADARAHVLDSTTDDTGLAFEAKDRFDGRENFSMSDDARLNRALRALAERFQATKAASEPVKVQNDDSWVGAATTAVAPPPAALAAPDPAPAPAPAPAVAPPPPSGSTGSSSSGTGSGSGSTNSGTNNAGGNGSSNGQKTGQSK